MQTVNAECVIGQPLAIEHANRIDRQIRCDGRPVRVGLLGYGRVGQAVAGVAARSRGRLRSAGIDIRCVGALIRDRAKPRFGPDLPLATDVADVFASRVDVLVEVMGGLEPARQLVVQALEKGIPVVSANKTLVAHSGLELQTLAARCGTTFAFDAAVLAGVPFLGSLSRRPLVSAAQTIAGVLNGTSNFILTRMGQGAAFEDALGEAVARGYAEPDSSADVTGLDAAQKLAILLHVAGCSGVCSGDLPRASLDIVDPRDLAAARRLRGVIKPLAVASLDPKSAGAWVGPAFLEDGHPFRDLNGVTNALQLTSSNGHAVTFAGPGAGPEVTATTILDDVVEVATGSHMTFVRPAAEVAGSTARLSQPPNGRWFIGVGDGCDVRPAHLAEFLAASGLPALHLIEDSGRCAAVTVPADWRTARDVIGALRASCSDVLAIPAFDGARDE